MHSGKSVLLILSSQNSVGCPARSIGSCLEELAAPYRVFAAADFHIEMATPRGGSAFLSPESCASRSANGEWLLHDQKAMDLFDSTLALDMVERIYDAYFVVGGWGALWDLPNHPILRQMLSNALADSHPVAAVSQGLAALTYAETRAGLPLLQGRRVACISDAEQSEALAEGIAPFSLERVLRQLGATVEQAPPHQPLVVTDGCLFSGQNTFSAELLAEVVRRALSVPQFAGA